MPFRTSTPSRMCPFTRLITDPLVVPLVASPIVASSSLHDTAHPSAGGSPEPNCTRLPLLMLLIFSLLLSPTSYAPVSYRIMSRLSTVAQGNFGKGGYPEGTSSQPRGSGEGKEAALLCPTTSARLLLGCSSPVL